MDCEARSRGRWSKSGNPSRPITAIGVDADRPASQLRPVRWLEEPGRSRCCDPQVSPLRRLQIELQGRRRVPMSDAAGNESTRKRKSASGEPAVDLPALNNSIRENIAACAAHRAASEPNPFASFTLLEITLEPLACEPRRFLEPFSRINLIVSNRQDYQFLGFARALIQFLETFDGAGRIIASSDEQ
jgi:hypothetical protein